MMEFTPIQKKISTILPGFRLLFAEPMSRHTSFRIGGPAAVMAFPASAQELSAILSACAEVSAEPVILGAGTNVLAPDEGIENLVICLKDCLGGMEQIGDSSIRVYAGVTMARAAVFAASLGLSGLEFAHGIPGTAGGGVYMNAGAYGGEICQVCSAVQVMDRRGRVRMLSNEEMGFAYRHSCLEDSGEIVVFADFTLEKKPEAEIREQMQLLISKRRASQPLDLPSAGSAFKRPVGGYAAALIDQAGLKGFSIGGAGVSTKHAGFVVNLGGATAADVKAVLAAVSEKVLEASGIRLEPEIRIW